MTAVQTPDLGKEMKITFTKQPGQKWQVKFEGKISRRDINRLRTTLLIVYTRNKRKSSLKNKVAQLQKTSAQAKLSEQNAV